MDKRFFSPVEIIENITPEKFKKDYLKNEKPVILRGLWKDYTASKKWTVEYFQKHLGHIEVGIYDSTLQKEDRSFKQAHRKMKFSEYLNIITSNEANDVRLFLFNIFKHKPDLKNDFSYPPLTRLYLKIPFMFFGGKNSSVRIHQDMDWSNVFLTQLYGRKEVYLFHPRYSKLLYKYPFGVHSSVNIDNPDYQKYPGLKYVEGLHCILEPGDTLFMPSGYWHYIKYLDGGYAINQRALSPYPVQWIKGFWNVVVLSNLDDLFRNIFGERWFNYKVKQTIYNANKAIENCINNGNSGKQIMDDAKFAEASEH
ncbi:MAG: cupin-like domain-containing protein [Prolixibacteraceae bacterium]|nr:cupin-like domain-containing protein [Prolixibacteraceae bacterium]